MSTPRLDQTLAVLNGLLGDHLARSDNGLATDLTFAAGGRPVTVAQATGALQSRRVVVLVHGLMSTEAVWQFPGEPAGTDYGSLLARDFDCAPLYVRYNSGRAISENGALLADLLASVAASASEIVLLGYSMGGLVARAACHVAAERGDAWLPLVRRAFYVGTPHLGAPLERVGRIVARVLRSVPDPVTRLVGEIADLRSQGLRDLAHADLRVEDRAPERLSLRDARHPVPLLPQIEHHLVAGTLPQAPWLAALFGDGLVTPSSGTFAGDATHVRSVPRAGHLDLAHSPLVYEHLSAWCREAGWTR